MGKHLDEIREAMEKFENGEEFVWENSNGEEVTIEPTYDKIISDAKKEIEESESMLEKFNMDKVDTYIKTSERLEKLQEELKSIEDEAEKAKKQEEIKVVENLLNPVKHYEKDAEKVIKYRKKIEKANKTIEEFENKKKSEYMLESKVRASKNIYYTQKKEGFESELQTVKVSLTRYKMDIIKTKGKIASAKSETEKNKWEKELKRQEGNYEKLLENLTDIEEAIKLCDEQKSALYETPAKENNEAENIETTKVDAPIVDETEEPEKIKVEEIEKTEVEESEKTEIEDEIEEDKDKEEVVEEIEEKTEEAEEEPKITQEQHIDELKNRENEIKKENLILQEMIQHAIENGIDTEKIKKMQNKLMSNKQELASIKHQIGNLDNSVEKDKEENSNDENLLGTVQAPVIIRRGFFRRIWDGIKALGRKIFRVPSEYKETTIRNIATSEEAVEEFNQELGKEEKTERGEDIKRRLAEKRKMNTEKLDKVKESNMEEPKEVSVKGEIVRVSERASKRHDAIFDKDDIGLKSNTGNIEARLNANAEKARKAKEQANQFKVEGVEGKFDPNQKNAPREKDTDGKEEK